MSNPQFITDVWGFVLTDPDGIALGRPPTPRLRVVGCVKPRHGPAPLRPPHYVTDPWGFTLSDPDGVAIGRPGVVLSRLIVASHDDSR